jgi:molybdate-binding protein/DNA-binding transcriptional regulator YhcF (GntR family)
MSTIIEKIKIDSRSLVPIYQQIAEQIHLLVVTEQIRPGEHLPSVRHLGFLLDISPNTVARAYLELERNHIVASKRGGGTVVAPGNDVQSMKEARQRHLVESINEDVVRMLNQGYGPEELQAAFYTAIERMGENRQISPRPADTARPIGKAAKVIRIVGSHDIALNTLVTLFRQRVTDTRVELEHVGSLGGLIAMAEGKADLAGAHLLDEETGEYNVPFIKRVLPGREIAIVNLVFRIQGLMVQARNPKNIARLADLRRHDVSFANRQKGSGTRVLLDIHLKRDGLDPRDIRGYATELDTHLEVATLIAEGKADCGLGIEAAARSCGLDFLPLFRERYDLVFLGHVYRSDLLAPLLSIVKSEEFVAIVEKMNGYDTSQTGSTAMYVT